MDTTRLNTAYPQPSAPSFNPSFSAPPTPAALPAPHMLSQNQRVMQLERILRQYEITIADANDLVLLQDYEIVFLADDSGSMTLCSVPPHERKIGKAMPTRWDELRETIRVVAEVACCFDADGIDIHFLNRPSIENMTSTDDPRFSKSFYEVPPSGGTPLTERLRDLVNKYSATEKPVLVLIATDGEPNGGPKPFMNLIRNTINKCKTNTKFRFQILACTEDDSQVSWLNDFDDATSGVDVTDDYYSERREVLAAGRIKTFNRSDWVIKALLGPISEKYDKLDQQQPSMRHIERLSRPVEAGDGCCCVM